MKSIEKKPAVQLEARRLVPFRPLVTGVECDTYDRFLKGDDWFSWTKAVAADVRSRHNGTCRVTVTLLTPIRSGYRIVTRTISYAGSRGATCIGAHTEPEERVVKAVSAPKCGTVIRSRV